MGCFFFVIMHLSISFNRMSSAKQHNIANNDGCKNGQVIFDFKKYISLNETNQNDSLVKEFTNGTSQILMPMSNDNLIPRERSEHFKIHTKEEESYNIDPRLRDKNLIYLISWYLNAVNFLPASKRTKNDILNYLDAVYPKNKHQKLKKNKIFDFFKKEGIRRSAKKQNTDERLENIRSEPFSDSQYQDVIDIKPNNLVPMLSQTEACSSLKSFNFPTFEENISNNYKRSGSTRVLLKKGALKHLENSIKFKSFPRSKDFEEECPCEKVKDTCDCEEYSVGGRIQITNTPNSFNDYDGNLDKSREALPPLTEESVLAFNKKSCETPPPDECNAPTDQMLILLLIFLLFIVIIVGLIISLCVLLRRLRKECERKREEATAAQKAAAEVKELCCNDFFENTDLDIEKNKELIEELGMCEKPKPDECRCSGTLVTGGDLYKKLQTTAEDLLWEAAKRNYCLCSCPKIPRKEDPCAENKRLVSLIPTDSNISAPSLKTQVNDAAEALLCLHPKQPPRSVNLALSGQKMNVRPPRKEPCGPPKKELTSIRNVGSRNPRDKTKEAFLSSSSQSYTSVSSSTERLYSLNKNARKFSA